MYTHQEKKSVNKAYGSSQTNTRKSVNDKTAFEKIVSQFKVQLYPSPPGQMIDAELSHDETSRPRDFHPESVQRASDKEDEEHHIQGKTATQFTPEKKEEKEALQGELVTQFKGTIPVDGKNKKNIRKVSRGETSGLFPVNAEKNKKSGNDIKTTKKDLYHPENWDSDLLAKPLKARAAINILSRRNGQHHTDSPNIKNTVDKLAAPCHLTDYFPEVDSEIKNDPEVELFCLSSDANATTHPISEVNWIQQKVKTYGSFHAAGGGDAGKGQTYILCYKAVNKVSKMISFYLLILFLLTNRVYGQDFKYSITRDDNDYVTYKDVHSIKEVTPQRVVAKFKSIVNGLKVNLKDVCSYSYKININESIDLFSLFIDYNQRNDCYIIAFNKSSGTITKVPIIIDMKWGFNNESGFNYKLLDYPLIDIKQKGSGYTICLKERVHNGNMYNAVMNKLYYLNKDLSFDLNFCYEGVSLTFDNQKIKRFLNNDTISVYGEKGYSLEYIGKIQIDNKTKEIVKRDCINDKFCQILFTTSGEKEEYILKNGYTVKY